jgi:excisionase family DNA binding protein
VVRATQGPLIPERTLPPDHDNLGGSNRLLPLTEAATLLGIERPRTLRDNWRRWGLTAYKVGRELRFRERDLNAWIAKQAA